jgi:hypothetical protein
MPAVNHTYKDSAKLFNQGAYLSNKLYAPYSALVNDPGSDAWVDTQNIAFMQTDIYSHAYDSYPKDKRLAHWYINGQWGNLGWDNVVEGVVSVDFETFEGARYRVATPPHDTMEEEPIPNSNR